MKVVKITPKKASEFIQRNVCNRPRRERRIDLYAAAMTAGVWCLNGETIKFNCNGDLVDGQHRLYAYIKSGKAFESYVIHGVPKEAFDTIDQGDKRSIGDVFARRGYKGYATLAAAVRWLWRYEGDMQRHGAMRPDIANEIIERHPALHTAVQKTIEVANKTCVINGSLFAFLDYWTGQNDQDRADRFWCSVVEGDGLQKGTPAYVLHKRLVGNLAAQAKLDARLPRCVSRRGTATSPRSPA